MDLSSGSKRLIVTMTHTSRDGSPKIVPRCELPLTALGVVDVVITELAVFRFVAGELVLVKVMPGSSLEEIAEKTSAKYRVSLEG